VENVDIWLSREIHHSTKPPNITKMVGGSINDENGLGDGGSAFQTKGNAPLRLSRYSHHGAAFQPLTMPKKCRTIRDTRTKSGFYTYVSSVPAPWSAFTLGWRRWTILLAINGSFSYSHPLRKPRLGS